MGNYLKSIQTPIFIIYIIMIVFLPSLHRRQPETIPLYAVLPTV